MTTIDMILLQPGPAIALYALYVAIASAIIGLGAIVASATPKDKVVLEKPRITFKPQHKDDGGDVIRAGCKFDVEIFVKYSFGSCFDWIGDSSKCGYIEITLEGPWKTKTYKEFSRSNEGLLEQTFVIKDMIPFKSGKKIDYRLLVKVRGENYGFWNDDGHRLFNEVTGTIDIEEGYEMRDGESFFYEPKVIFHGNRSRARANLRVHATITGIADVTILDYVKVNNTVIPAATETSDEIFELISIQKGDPNHHKCNKSEQYFSFTNFYTKCRIPKSEIPAAEDDYEVEFFNPDLTLPVICKLADLQLCNGDLLPVDKSFPKESEAEPKDKKVSGKITLPKSHLKMAFLTVTDNFGKKYKINIDSAGKFSQEIKIGHAVVLEYGAKKHYKSVKVTLPGNTLENLNLTPPLIYAPSIYGSVKINDNSPAYAEVYLLDTRNSKSQNLIDITDENGNFQIPALPLKEHYSSNGCTIKIIPKTKLGRKFVIKKDTFYVPFIDLNNESYRLPNSINLGTTYVDEIFNSGSSRTVLWKGEFYFKHNEKAIKNLTFNAIEITTGKILASDSTDDEGKVQLKIPYKAKFVITSPNYKEFNIREPESIEYIAEWPVAVKRLMPVIEPILDAIPLAGENNIIGRLATIGPEEVILKVNGIIKANLTGNNIKRRVFHFKNIETLQTTDKVEIIEVKNNIRFTSGIFSVRPKNNMI